MAGIDSACYQDTVTYFFSRRQGAISWLFEDILELKPKPFWPFSRRGKCEQCIKWYYRYILFHLVISKGVLRGEFSTTVLQSPSTKHCLLAQFEVNHVKHRHKLNWEHLGYLNSRSIQGWKAIELYQTTKCGHWKSMLFSGNISFPNNNWFSRNPIIWCYPNQGNYY